MSLDTLSGMEVRDRLLHAALRVFEEAGSRGATTRRIAAEAGVNEITLFRHFGSKSVLLSEALAAANRQPVETGLPADPRDPEAELLAWSRAGYAHLRRHAAMIRTTLGELAEAPDAARCVADNPMRVHSELLAYLHRLRERGMAATDWDPDAAANLLMGSIFADAVARDAVPEKYPYPEAEAPARYVKMFLRAIGAVPGPADGPGAAGAAPAGGAH
ncbi:MAG TPA: TetR/AcrR family transcriptional regulator [Longimicrobium sp.]|nr:TetR/AcrR family transcriptional regulator [Longimicrobium sp.]